MSNLPSTESAINVINFFGGNLDLSKIVHKNSLFCFLNLHKNVKTMQFYAESIVLQNCLLHYKYFCCFSPNIFITLTKSKEKGFLLSNKMRKRFEALLWAGTVMHLVERLIPPLGRAPRS